MPLSIFNFLPLLSFIGAFVGFGLIMYSRHNKNPKFTALGMFLCAQLFFLVIVTSINSSEQNEHIQEKIRKFAHKPDLIIMADNQLMDSVRTKELAIALTSIISVDAHHSHPEDIKTVHLISAKDTIRLTIGKDSYNSTEYWVCQAPYQELHNEIGRIYIDTGKVW
jgi:hypothetical protein